MRALKNAPRLLLLAVAALVIAATSAIAATSSGPAPGAYTTHGAWTFVSAPKLHPPKLHTDAKTAGKGLARGDFFLSNFVNITMGKPSVGQGGPLILDSHLRPVWFLPVSGAYANNLREQTYDGKPALSWWQGLITNTGQTTQGTDYVVNQRYQTVVKLVGAPGWFITQHEMIIQGHDAWVTANSAPVQFQGHTIIDSAVQEYDLSKCSSSGVCPLLVNWTASAHIPLSASHQAPPPAAGAAWDAYHVNSIQILPGGTHGEFLVSMRNTWSAYLVDIATGDIVWTIDGSGKAGTFKLPANGHFAWQHDVELHSGGLLSLFDDECCELTYKKPPFDAPEGASRGLLLRLDTATGTAAYVHEYVHAQVQGSPVETAFQGNMQLLPDHNVVVGWGSAPFFSEFTYSGKLLFDSTLPNPDVSYRAYVFNWVGKPPLSALRQVAKRSHGKTTIYVSWDGATQVVSWRVLGGSSAGHLRTVATALWGGFETAVPLKQGYKVYRVQALDSRGHVLATSSAFSVATKMTCPPTCGGY